MNKDNLIIGLIVVFIGLTIYNLVNTNNLINQPKDNYSDSLKYVLLMNNKNNRIDTTFIITKPEIYYKTIKSDTTIINYLDSTKYEVSSFKDSTHLVIDKDTINATYQFPDRNFNFIIRKGIDSNLVLTKNIFIPIEEKLLWYEKPSFIIPTTILGASLIFLLAK